MIDLSKTVILKNKVKPYKKRLLSCGQWEKAKFILRKYRFLDLLASSGPCLWALSQKTLTIVHAIRNFYFILPEYIVFPTSLVAYTSLGLMHGVHLRRTSLLKEIYGATYTKPH